jgi:ATP-binding cassette subfamily B protein
MSDVIDVGVANGDMKYIIKVGMIMLAVAITSGIFSMISSYLSAKIGVGFAKSIREKVFTKIISYSLHEIDDKGTASLITRATNDITQLQNATIMAMRFFTRAPIMAVGSIILALKKDVPLTWVIIVSVILMGIFITLVAAKVMPLFKKIQGQVDQLNLVAREHLTGMRVIRAFNRKQKEQKRFNDANSDLMAVTIKVNKISAITNPCIQMFFYFTSVAIVWFGAKRIEVQAIGAGDLIAFIQYATYIMFSVRMLTMAFMMVPRAFVSASRIAEVLDVDPEIKDPIQAIEAEGEKGTIEFREVSFTYSTDNHCNEAAISGISFKAKAGEITAIIGGTGSGKSTLVNMIPRFYDVDSGAVMVNGTNVKDMTLEDLRSKIAIVPQKSLLFTGSVAENIRYGAKQASDEEMKRVAKIAQVDEFVQQMSEGYGSVIAQGGKNVSGGQKQRISIARALIKKPDVYIFDDSFSALDFKTESKLKKALLKEIAHSTVLIVAQKIVTVKDADQIIVLENGKIVGKGTHDQLAKENKIYQEIILSQLSKEELA